MEMIFLFFSYIFWHYTQALVDLFNIWVNIFKFLFNYFSLGMILKTFFTPWHRFGEKYKGKTDPFELFSSLIINIIMRILGIILRTIIVIIALLLLIIASLSATLSFLLWLLWPLIIIILFFTGLGVITKALI